MQDTDEYVDVALKHRRDIAMLYRAFAEKNPIMMFDRQEERVYAYPYAEFLKEMIGPRTQAPAREQYEEAVRSGQMLVFIRDNVKRRFVSVTLDVE